MTPNEIYALPEDVPNLDGNLEFLQGCYYNFVPELPEYQMDWEKATQDGSVKIKVHRHYTFDGRRYWRLASVWFNDKPIMITQNAGREGDDHAMRFITDDVTYIYMISHLIKFCKPIDLPPSSDDEKTKRVGPNEDAGDLLSFYGDNFHTVSLNRYMR